MQPRIRYVSFPPDWSCVPLVLSGPTADKKKRKNVRKNYSGVYTTAAVQLQLYTVNKAKTGVVRRVLRISLPLLLLVVVFVMQQQTAGKETDQNKQERASCCFVYINSR